MVQHTEVVEETPTETSALIPAASEALSAEEEAQNLDAELAELTACMKASVAGKQRRARTRGKVGISLALACILGIVCWTYAVSRGVMSVDTMPMAVTVFLIIMPIAIFLGQVAWALGDHKIDTRQVPDVVTRFMQLDDVRLFGLLLDTYYLYGTYRIPAFWKAMGSLLRRMTADEIQQLGTNRQAILATWVLGWDRPGNRKMFAEVGTPFLLNLLPVMAQLGQSSYYYQVSSKVVQNVPMLPTLEKWAVGQGAGQDPQVQQAAIACREAIRQKMALARTGAQLLRASIPTPGGSETLLRPTESAQQTDPTELLRPGDPAE